MMEPLAEGGVRIRARANVLPLSIAWETEWERKRASRRGSTPIRVPGEDGEADAESPLRFARNSCVGRTAAVYAPPTANGDESPPAASVSSAALANSSGVAFSEPG